MGIRDALVPMLCWLLVGAAHAQTLAPTSPAPDASVPADTQVEPAPSTPALAPSPAPAAPSPAHSAIDASLISADIAALENERAELGLTGPIVLLSIGGAGFLLGTSLVLVGVAGANYCHPDDVRCVGIDDTTRDTLYVVGGALAVAGGIGFVIGLVQLLDRIEERRTLGLQIRQLREKLGPQYGLLLGPEHAGLTMRFRL